MGRAMGGYSHSRHDQTASVSDVRRRDIGFASSAARTFSFLPIRQTLGALGRLRRGGGRLLQRAAGLDRTAGARSVGRITGSFTGSKNGSASARAPAPE